MLILIHKSCMHPTPLHWVDGSWNLSPESESKENVYRVALNCGIYFSQAAAAAIAPLHTFAISLMKCQIPIYYPSEWKK